MDARALYPEASLADLYDGKLMKILYPKLRAAHQANDRAVLQAYGFDEKMADEAREGELVAELMGMYEGLVDSQQTTDDRRQPIKRTPCARLRA